LTTSFKASLTTPGPQASLKQSKVSHAVAVTTAARKSIEICHDMTSVSCRWTIVSGCFQIDNGFSFLVHKNVACLDNEAAQCGSSHELLAHVVA